MESSLIPSVSGSETVSAYNLGGTNERWKGVYASTINVSGSASVGSLSTSGDIRAGSIIGSGFSTSGNISATGVATVGSLSTSGAISGGAISGTSLSTGGDLTATGSATVGSLSTSGAISGGAISGSSLSTSGTISGGAISGSSFSTSGTISGGAISGSSLSTSGDLTVSGSATVGSLSTSGTISGGTISGSSFSTSGAATVGTISASNAKTSGTFTSTGYSYGSDGINIGETTFTNKVACGIYAKANGGGGPSAGATNIGIYAYATGSGKSGNVKNTNYAIYAKASGNNAYSYAGYFEGDIEVSGTIYGSVSGSSDSRLKKDVQTIDGALGKVLKLRGVSYYWKNKAEMGADSAYAHNDTEKHIGVIAQEIEQEFPELVKTDHHGYKTVEYSAIAPILIEAVKELKAEKDALQAEKDALEAKVEKLEAQMQEILEKLK